MGFHLFEAFGDFDSAAFASSAGVDLRLDGEVAAPAALAAQFFGGAARLADAMRDLASRRGDVKAAEDLLRLIFVQIQGRLPISISELPTGRLTRSPSYPIMTPSARISGTPRRKMRSAIKP